MLPNGAAFSKPGPMPANIFEARFHASSHRVEALNSFRLEWIRVSWRIHGRVLKWGTLKTMGFPVGVRSYSPKKLPKTSLIMNIGHVESHLW